MTHAQRCKAAMQSLFQLLARIEAVPDRAQELARRRHLFAVAAGPGGAGADPIEPTTATHQLAPPHPLAGQDGFVGAFDMATYETAMLDRLEPLGYSSTRDDLDWLGADWYLEDYSAHLDPSMPREHRERIAAVLEKAGAEPDESRKGEAGCATTGKLRRHSERYLPDSVDKLANTAELHWCPAALAPLLREHGLRIRPDILARLGVGPDGRRLDVVPSSHA